MKIGKVKRKILKPDAIPVILPKPQPILAPDIFKPQPVPSPHPPARGGLVNGY